jgi:ABC-type multidrug transport system ATPase subunit
VLTLKDIQFTLPGADIPLLSGISARYPAGHFGAIVGPSGCGKSTLLKVIAGILPQYDGNIFWHGRSLEEQDLPAHELGYVPQFSCIQPFLTVQENLSYTARLRRGDTSRAITELVGKTLEETGLGDLRNRRAGVLSGGQLRRLALAMELTTQPDLLLADEVTSGLDPKSEEEITQLLSHLARIEGRVVLLVTHSLRFLDSYDSVTVLYGGRLTYSADPRLLTNYFQVANPDQIYPALTESEPAFWSEEWLNSVEPEVLTPLHMIHEVESRIHLADKQSHLLLPGYISQTTTWLSRRIKLFLRDPAQVFLQLSLLLIFPAVVTLFAYRGLPSVRNMAMSSDLGIVDQLRETLAFTAQSSRIGTLVSGLAMFQVILLALMASNNSAREVVAQRDILEKEKLAGLRPTAVLSGMVLFLSVLVFLQAAWMTLFVRAICQFPGSVPLQFLPFLALSGAVTAMCLAISSWAKTSEQSSLGSLYLVGFQLPLSGALLALPDFLGWITRPLISGYWAWSAYLQTLRDTRFYDLVSSITETPLANYPVSIWILMIHLGLGLVLSLFGITRSRWP